MTTHDAHHDAPTAPATPPVGPGTSEGAAGPQIGAGELGAYTPTQDDVREDFAYPWEGFQQDREGRLAAFDRWLAKHDAGKVAPAAPPVGEETSGPETDSQGPAGEISLGDALRAFANAHTTSWPLHGTMRRHADRADALERGGRELGRILDRELTAVLDLSGAHHLIDEDGDGDWGAVWDILGELVEKGKKADELQRTIDSLNDEATRQSETIGRVRDIAALDTTPLLTATQLHGALDGTQ
jgi:hypothetical protein